ncbi:MAG: hypothetical protein JWO22_1655, partial [Frankiales bacterium]|nr:hypothetical protein [Frankiales bacterium]
ATGVEVSDECYFLFGTTEASGADIHIYGLGYIVLEELRNSKSPFGCVMS